MIGTPSAVTARAAPERCASCALVLWRSSTRGSRTRPSGAGLAAVAAMTAAIIAAPPHHLRLVMSTSLQPELDGEEHPHRHRFLAAPPRLELPAAHGVGGRLVEIRVSGALLDDHVADLSVDEHVDAQHGRALDAEAARRGRVSRP